MSSRHLKSLFSYFIFDFIQLLDSYEICYGYYVIRHYVIAVFHFL
jgi:hypothetical protein